VGPLQYTRAGAGTDRRLSSLSLPHPTCLSCSGAGRTGPMGGHDPVQDGWELAAWGSDAGGGGLYLSLVM
jgi:hypothetical protein